MPTDESMHPSSNPTDSATATNSIDALPSLYPTGCPPSDPILIKKQGETMYPELPVIITHQNTTHVGFKVQNTFADTVSSIFTEYHPGAFGTECLEDQNIQQNSHVETDFVAQCMHSAKISVINVWITD